MFTSLGNANGDVNGNSEGVGTKQICGENAEPPRFQPRVPNQWVVAHKLIGGFPKWLKPIKTKCGVFFCLHQCSQLQ